MNAQRDKELHLRNLIENFFSDEQFYLDNKEWIYFELNHLEIHNLDNYLYNSYTKGINSLANPNNSSIAYLIGLTDCIPVNKIKTKGGTAPD